jgi:hypothetical protein
MFYLPRLPFQLHPLILEAKKRARRRRFVLIVALALVAVSAGALGRWELGGASASAATTSSGKQCARSSTYGSQCVDVLGSGRRVTEIQTWFDDTGMFWPNERWRVDLERYLCDPIGKGKATCWAMTTWHGRVLTGAEVVGRQTQPLHLAQSRTSGYWPTFDLPHTFRSNVWLCTEVAAFNAATNRWVYNAAGLPHGLRACVSVHR